MIIRAPRPHANFTWLRNSVIQDVNLSFKARGVLFYILSKPDNWVVRVPDLIAAGGENEHGRPHNGRDSIYSALAELEAAGYLTRTKTRNPKGQWVHVQQVHDEPQKESK